MAGRKHQVLTADGHLARHPREIENEKRLAGIKTRLDHAAAEMGIGSVIAVAPEWLGLNTKEQPAQTYAAGDFVAFRHLPATRFAAPERRYSAFRVFAVSAIAVVVAILDGSFDDPPTMSEVAALSLLRRSRYATPGDVAAASVQIVGSRLLGAEPSASLQFRWLGNVPLSAADIGAVGTPTRSLDWRTFCADAEAEWRWRRDRERFVDELRREYEREAKPSVSYELLGRLLPLIRKGPTPKWPGKIAALASSQVGKPSQQRPFAQGDFYGFRVLPSYDFSVQDRPRYAALRVFAIERSTKAVTVAILDGLFDAAPTLSEVRELPIQRYRRSGFGGRPMVQAVPIGLRPPPDLGLRLLGNVPLASAELDWFGGLAPIDRPYGAWEFAGRMPEFEWRWQHDGERLVEEGLRAAFERDAAQMAAADYYRDRLKSLTWNKILSEPHFENWPSRSRALAEGGRGAIDQTIRDIVALGPKPKKAAVRDALKACVEWFNVEDDKLGGVIEIAEREDILQLLADICYVARQSALNGELDEWRKW